MENGFEAWSEFEECDGSGEDPYCSDSNILDLSVEDHLSYMQVCGRNACCVRHVCMYVFHEHSSCVCVCVCARAPRRSSYWAVNRRRESVLDGLSHRSCCLLSYRVYTLIGLVHENRHFALTQLQHIVLPGLGASRSRQRFALSWLTKWWCVGRVLAGQQCTALSEVAGPNSPALPAAAAVHLILLPRQKRSSGHDCGFVC